MYINLFVATTPGIGFLTDHQVGIRENILDLVWMIILLAFWPLVVSKMNIINHFHDLAQKLAIGPVRGIGRLIIKSLNNLCVF